MKVCLKLDGLIDIKKKAELREIKMEERRIDFADRMRKKLFRGKSDAHISKEVHRIKFERRKKLTSLAKGVDYVIKNRLKVKDNHLTLEAIKKHSVSPLKPKDFHPLNPLKKIKFFQFF